MWFSLLFPPWCFDWTVYIYIYIYIVILFLYSVRWRCILELGKSPITIRSLVMCEWRHNALQTNELLNELALADYLHAGWELFRFYCCIKTSTDQHSVIFIQTFRHSFKQVPQYELNSKLCFFSMYVQCIYVDCIVSLIASNTIACSIALFRPNCVFGISLHSFNCWISLPFCLTNIEIRQLCY